MKVNSWHCRTSLVLGTVALAAGVCFSQAQPPAEDWEHLYQGSQLLIGKEKAWLVQKPRAISLGRVIRIAVGPGPGEAILIIGPRETISTAEALAMAAEESKPQGPFRLQVVSLANGSIKRSFDLPTSAFSDGDVPEITGRFFEVLQYDPDRLLLIDTLKGGVRNFADGESRFSLASALAEIVCLERQSSSPQERGDSAGPRVTLFELVDFSQNPPQVTPVQVRVTGRPLGLLANGNLACAVKSGFIEVSLKDGSSKPLSGLEAMRLAGETEELEAKPSLRIQEESEVVSLVASEGGPRPKLKLSEEAGYALLDSDGAKALFIAHDAGFVVDIAPVDLAAAMRALLSHAKHQAMSYAKQSGMAAHIYAADNDDCLPLSGSQARDALMPYLRNKMMLEHIVWTNLTGQDLGKITAPSQTVLGYLPGPGGRAVIYSDSSVRWVAD